jgi:hypothetical protein
MKAVSRPSIRNQEQRFGRVWFDFLSEPVYKDAEVFQLVSIIGPPYCLKQFAMGNGLVRARQKICEEPELSCGES